MTGLQDQLKQMLLLFLMCALQTGHLLFRDMTSVAQTRQMVWPHGSRTVLISLSSQIVHTGTCDSYKKIITVINCGLGLMCLMPL
jgi:hypothetical protein